MAENKLKNLSMEFAKEIVLTCKEIKEVSRESILTNQLIRSGTSIGANIHEANYAQSKPDFISKFHIALKEAHETEYWLELLYQTGYLNLETKKHLKNLCGTIRKLLIASLNTAKGNKKNNIN